MGFVGTKGQPDWQGVASSCGEAAEGGGGQTWTCGVQQGPHGFHLCIGNQGWLSRGTRAEAKIAGVSLAHFCRDRARSVCVCVCV